MVPTTGAVGVSSMLNTILVAGEIQVSVTFAVTLYELSATPLNTPVVLV
jgi:hypothetical protein